MSIEIISHRQDRHCPSDVHLSTIKASVGRAVISAVRYELGYGGVLQIKEDHMTTRSLTIVTPVMSKIDTTSFTADTDEEYLALVSAVAMFMAIKMQLTDDVLLKRHFPNMDTKGMRAFVSKLESLGADVLEFSGDARPYVYTALRYTYGLHRDVALEMLSTTIEKQFKQLTVTGEMLEQALDAAIEAFERDNTAS